MSTDAEINIILFAGFLVIASIYLRSESYDLKNKCLETGEVLRKEVLFTKNRQCFIKNLRGNYVLLSSYEEKENSNLEIKLPKLPEKR